MSRDRTLAGDNSLVSKRSKPSSWLELIIPSAVAVFLGCLWWLRGRPVIGRQAKGWRFALVLGARVAILAGGIWLVDRPSTQLWGTGVILCCGVMGWLAFLRRFLSKERKEARPDQPANGTPRPSQPTPKLAHPPSRANPELAEQMRLLVLQRRERGLRP